MFLIRLQLKRIGLTVLFSFFIFSFITAQDRSNYALLWEIEHKDSDKKSYLFGTMHLRDKRVFNFTDALLPSIKQSEVFALEVDPENIATKYIESLSKKDFSDTYKDILAKEDYALLQEKIKNATGKSLEELSENNPEYIQSVLRPDLNKDDDRDVFLDLYLYQIAASLDKEIQGLEELEDQKINYDKASNREITGTIKGLINHSKDEYVSQIENLIEIYVSGDLAKIQAYTAESIGFYKATMQRRNEKMVQSMKEIMKSKSVFAAIGAAHLPGEVGVIELLKKEGYTVRSVENSFTGKSNNYTFTPNLEKWETIKDSINGYSLKQPISAQKFDMLNFSGFSGENAYIDFKSGANFFHFSIDMTDRDKAFQAEMADSFVENVKKSDTTAVISSGKVKRNEHQFSQVVIKSSGKRVAHFELLSKHGYFYIFGVEYSPSIAKATAESFFNSIVIDKPKVKETSWESYTDPKGAFTVQVPGEINDMSRVIPNPENPDGDPYEMTLLAVKDAKKNHNYLIRYNNFPIGYYLKDISDIYDALLNQLKTTGATIIDEKKFEFDGHVAYDFEVMIQDKYQAIFRYISRGNRTYVLLAQSLVENETVTADNPLFNSFTFDPYTQSDFDRIQNAHHQLSFLLPKKNREEENLEVIYNSYYGDAIDYFGLNEDTGGSYSVYLSDLKKYFRVKEKDVDVLFDDFAYQFQEYSDTIYKTEKGFYKKYPTKTYYLSSKKTPIIKKYKFHLIENQMTILGAYLGKKEVNSEITNSFFNGIQVDDLNPFDVYSSKAKLILKDLESKDTLTRFEATGALDYYTFEPSEKKVLEKGLLKTYIQDTSYYGIKNMIIYNLGLVGDDTSVSKLVSYYNSSKATNRNRLMTLSALPLIKTAAAQEAYFKLLNTNPPVRTKEDPYPVLEAVSDSVFNYKIYGDNVLKLNHNPLFRDHVIDYWREVVAQDSTAIDYLKSKKELVFEYFESDARTLIDTTLTEKPLYLTNEGIIADYISLMSTLDLDTENTKPIIEQLLAVADKRSWYTYRIYDYYINHTEAPEAATVSVLLDDLYYRFEAMELLITAGKSDLIPKTYLEPVPFSKLSLYYNLGEYHGYPNEMEYQETIMYEEEAYDVYVASFTEISEEEEEEASITKYLGVVKKDAANLDEFKLLDSYYSYDVMTEEPVKDQAITLLKSLEED